MNVILFPDCGIGSDPDATGPCTGTYGPEHLGESVTGVFASGKGQVLSVGAAILAMFAVVVLLNMLRRPLKRPKAEKKADHAAADDADLIERAGGLSAGEALCLSCGADYDAEVFDACPCCGGGTDPLCQRCGAVNESGEPLCADCFADDLAEARASGVFDEPPADAGTCSVCGVVTDELVGDLFPACHDCAAASEAQRATDEIGPDDEDTFDGNPNGIGGGGVRA